jgi:hypothetical protein
MVLSWTATPTSRTHCQEAPLIRKHSLWAIMATPLVVLLLGCSGGDEDSDPTPTMSAGGATQTTATSPAAATGTSTPAAGGGGATNELAGIAGAYAQVRSFRAQMVLEAPGAPAQQASLEVIQPDRQHITYSAGGLGNIEVILIGTDAYYKVGPAPWTRQAVSGINLQLFDPKTINSTVQGLQQAGATRGATATVSGRTCQIYTFTTQGASQELCIADNLPLRIISTAGGVKTTITFSDYNASFQIQPPI